MADSDVKAAWASPGVSQGADTLDGLIDAARRLLDLHPEVIRLRVAHGDCVVELGCSSRARLDTVDSMDGERTPRQASPEPGRHRRATDAVN